MSTAPAKTDSATLFRRIIFVILLLLMAWANLFILFNGLSAPAAMDQAQIGREISRGNGFTTKFIRPAAYQQAAEAAGSASFSGFKDTYHSPLNPLIYASVLKLVDADQAETWQMGPNTIVYELDRVIATVCVLFFLVAIGMNYLLISRIFDARIAGVCALLMLFCDVLWDFALSGLPQMLMLMLFSCAIYFVYRALESAEDGRVSMPHATIAGVFFTLLALAHWMTVWIAIGYIIFAALTFRPRPFVGVIVLLMILVTGVFFMVRNYDVSGSPFGTAYLALYNGLGKGGGDAVLRTTNLNAALDLNGLIGKIVRTTLLQLSEIIPLLGKIIVAPLFFLALLHPFKRKSISNFRWAILLMWLGAAICLAFFGVSTTFLDPNNLHILFAPIMAAYGLALISVLWSRLDFVAANPFLKNAHLIAIAVICSLPMVLSLKTRVERGMAFRDKGGTPQWPPYWPAGLNSGTSGLKSYVDAKSTTFSDQPWAVAWYADRMSIWLPSKRDDLEAMEDAAAKQQSPAAGILISPSSHNSGTISEVARDYEDFTPLVLDGKILAATYPPGFTIFDKSQKLQEVARRYPYRKLIVGSDMIFYSDRPLDISAPAN